MEFTYLTDDRNRNIEALKNPRTVLVICEGIAKITIEQIYVALGQCELPCLR